MEIGARARVEPGRPDHVPTLRHAETSKPTGQNSDPFAEAELNLAARTDSDNSISVSKMADAGKDHCHVAFVGGVDHF